MHNYKNGDLYWRHYFECRVIYYTLMTMIVAGNASDKNEYNVCRKSLFDKTNPYYKNEHLWKILKRNYGYLKALAIAYIVPLGYTITKALCKIAFSQ